MHSQAPSGPWKPQNRTLAARSTSLPAKVVWSTSQPQLVPAMMPLA